MGKRPYYVIMWNRDYEGHESIIEYVGTNYAAAKARYRWLYDFLRQREFVDEGVAEDRIEGHFNELPAIMNVGQSVCSSLYDNDCYYIDIEIKCLNANTWSNGSMEDRYKLDFPNSKY